MPSQIVHPGYEWSHDYDLLLQLMERGEVYGTVLYEGIGHDPVRFKRDKNPEFRYCASARGIHYIDTWGGSPEEGSQEEQFKEHCAKLGARFLVPQETARIKELEEHLQNRRELWKRERARAEAAEAWCEALESALKRTRHNFELAVAGKPVRDMAETLAEVDAALAKSGA